MQVVVKEHTHKVASIASSVSHLCPFLKVRFIVTYFRAGFICCLLNCINQSTIFPPKVIGEYSYLATHCDPEDVMEKLCSLLKRRVSGSYRHQPPSE